MSSLGQRLEVDRRRAADRGAPAGSPIEQFRSRLGQDEDGRRAGPGQEMLDEVEQALIGPLQVPEHEDGRATDRPAARRTCARPRTAPRGIDRQVVETEQPRQARLDPAPLDGVGDHLLEHRIEPASRRSPVSSDLGDPGRPRTISAKRPVADAVAVRGRPALVPEDRLEDAVEVLLELPGEPALADARLSDDRDQPGLAFALGGVEVVLEQRAAPRPDRRTAARSPRCVPSRRDARRRPVPASAGTGAVLPLSDCPPTARTRSRPTPPGRSPRRRGPCRAPRPTGAARRC